MAGRRLRCDANFGCYKSFAGREKELVTAVTNTIATILSYPALPRNYLIWTSNCFIFDFRSTAQVLRRSKMQGGKSVAVQKIALRVLRDDEEVRTSG
jgi:hypothetical protein